MNLGFNFILDDTLNLSNVDCCETIKTLMFWVPIKSPKDLTVEDLSVNQISKCILIKKIYDNIK